MYVIWWQIIYIPHVWLIESVSRPSKNSLWRSNHRSCMFIRRMRWFVTETPRSRLACSPFPTPCMPLRFTAWPQWWPSHERMLPHDIREVKARGLAKSTPRQYYFNGSIESTCKPKLFNSFRSRRAHGSTPINVNIVNLWVAMADWEDWKEVKELDWFSGWQTTIANN